MSHSKSRDPDYLPSDEWQTVKGTSSKTTSCQSSHQFKTKRDLHEHLDRRCGYRVMPLKNACCTLEYLRKIFAQTVWCP
jgi:hypothetical protein